jgi:hypothetical protein
MNLTDMLKEHQLWLDKAHKTLTSTKAGDDARAELKQPRAEHIKARIAELTRQKEREIKRYDAAISGLNDELAGLGAKPAAEGASRPPAAKRSKKAAKAKAGK